jgi:hypothetical protein
MSGVAGPPSMQEQRPARHTAANSSVVQLPFIRGHRNERLTKRPLASEIWSGLKAEVRSGNERNYLLTSAIRQEPMQGH